MRQVLAAIVIGVALAIASLSWWGFGMLRTVLDTDRSEQVADVLLEDDAVRAQLVDNLAAAVLLAVPEGVEVDRAEVESYAAAALDSPAVETLVRDAFVQVHAGFLGDGEVPRQLDLGGVIDAVQQAAVDARPELAGSLPAAPELTVELPTERVPDVGWMRRGLERWVPIGAVVAGLGVLAAMVMATNRAAILRRAGFWAIGAAIVWLVLGLGIPWLATRLFAGQAVVAGALIDAVSGGMVTPALLLGGLGLAALAASVVWVGRHGELRVNPIPPPIVVVPAAAPIAHAAVAPPGGGARPWIAPPPAPPPAAPPAPPQTPAAPPADPAPAWQEGVGYLAPDPAPRWVEGIGYIDDDQA